MILEPIMLGYLIINALILCCIFADDTMKFVGIKGRTWIYLTTIFLGIPLLLIGMFNNLIGVRTYEKG